MLPRLALDRALLAQLMLSPPLYAELPLETAMLPNHALD